VASLKVHILLLFFFSLTPFSLVYGTENISVYFSPKDHCDQKLIQALNGTQSTLNIAIYSLTKKEIADAIIAAKLRGVNVRVVVDRQQAGGESSKDEYLREDGIPVLEDKHPGLMHNKFAVIDGNLVITGSYNWTDGATNKNDENMLIISSPEIAQKYDAEFEELLQENK
jgi:phosphatidylserine/phosphatidylglycerophosphate/cardiolipin synthase-like enzyme